ncbi:MAG: hypothetical protein WBP72_16335 [Rhodocyclaceae bacterium]
MRLQDVIVQLLARSLFTLNAKCDRRKLLWAPRREAPGLLIARNGQSVKDFCRFAYRNAGCHEMNRSTGQIAMRLRCPDVLAASAAFVEDRRKHIHTATTSDVRA